MSFNDDVANMIAGLGEDPTREGLKDTPERVRRAWQHDLAWGYNITENMVGDILKAFKDGGENYDEMICQRDIALYSNCEHHMLPFFGVAHIGYIPQGKIVGLSKLARVVDVYARRLQVQERLTHQIAQALQTHLKPYGVGVVVEARHLCMESRGVQKQGTVTQTSAMLGAFREVPSARAEFMSFINKVGRTHV